MSTHPDQRYFDAIDATWAPADFKASGPFQLRAGKGGGKRVSAASLAAPTASADDIKSASEAMKEMGQTPLFMLKPGQVDFDKALEDQGFSVIDPSVLYACPAQDLAQYAPKGLAAIPGEIPLAIQKEIWELDGIGPARIGVMARSKSPKSFILGRHDDHPAGTVFVSCDGDTAMLHALVVHPEARRAGVGKNLTYGCAKWAMRQGATTLALMTTQANQAARQLYESIGMTEVSRYHYRIKSD